MTSEAATFHNPEAPRLGKLSPTAVGSMNYNILATLIKDANLLRHHRGVEVGVLHAATSSYLLKNFPALQMICVDPYLSYEEYEANRTQQKMSEAERIARQRLSPYSARVKFIKDFSVPAAAQVADNSVDFVFIDAIHTYNAVKEDLAAWFPKVRNQGMLLGHDVSWDGVRQAVEEFTVSIGTNGFYTPSTSDVWFFVKP